MNIVVLVKQVPDTYSERRLNDADGILDRAASDAVLDEISERAVEAALQLKEAHDGEVTVACMGPGAATDAIRKALSMGADRAAKKKPVTQLSAADAGIGAAEVGLASALTTVTSVAPRPPKSAGEKVTDEGDGGSKIAAYLVSQKLI